jgi:hypothetical protein
VIIKASEVFRLPAEKLFSVEFEELLPLMDDPEDYREVDRNIQRALSNLKGV